MRKIVGAVVVLALFCGIALAEEIRAVITKVDGDKVTFFASKGKDDKGPEQTLPVANDAKIVKGKFNKDTKKVEVGEALKDGLKNEVFTKIGDKGVRATVVTDADNKKITEIRVFSGFGKKKQDK